MYYKKAAAVIFVYSMNDYESLDHLARWGHEVDENASSRCIKIVACAKSDCFDDDEVVPKSEGQDYAR